MTSLTRFMRRTNLWLGKIDVSRFDQSVASAKYLPVPVDAAQQRRGAPRKASDRRPRQLASARAHGASGARSARAARAGGGSSCCRGGVAGLRAGLLQSAMSRWRADTSKVKLRYKQGQTAAGVEMPGT